MKNEPKNGSFQISLKFIKNSRIFLEIFTAYTKLRFLELRGSPGSLNTVIKVDHVLLKNVTIVYFHEQ